MQRPTLLSSENWARVMPGQLTKDRIISFDLVGRLAGATPVALLQDHAGMRERACLYHSTSRSNPMSPPSPTSRSRCTGMLPR